MPTPPKPYVVLTAEKKSHRTKSELSQRKKEEEALATGLAMRERDEVKEDPAAHQEYLRLNRMLRKIQKNDGLYESVVNRYCEIQSECMTWKTRIAQTRKLQEQLEDRRDEMDFIEYFDRAQKIGGLLVAQDKQVQSKREMLLKIEKENIMTVAAALRAIPKKSKDDEEEDPMAKILKGRG
jgi:phage terminase small subunit